MMLIILSHVHLHPPNPKLLLSPRLNSQEIHYVCTHSLLKDIAQKQLFTVFLQPQTAQRDYHMFTNVQTLVHFLSETHRLCRAAASYFIFSSFLCSMVSQSLGREWCHVKLAVDAWTSKATIPGLHFSKWTLPMDGS